jgi:hypothetical protein
LHCESKTLRQQGSHDNVRIHRAVTAVSRTAIGTIIGGALVVLADPAAAQTVPLPAAHPAIDAPTDRGIDSHPGPTAAQSVTACQRRLSADHVAFKPLGEISGPGGCGGADIVLLERVAVTDRTEIAIDPPATLRCETAEAIASFVQSGLVPAVAPLGSALVAVENFESYECRGRNRVVGAPLSEHGRANALDIRALRLKDGRVLHPTDDAVPHAFRLAMKNLACARFMTVLGPGSDGYHEDHVHVDLAERASGYRLCQWDLHDVPHPASQAPAGGNGAPVGNLRPLPPIPLPRPRPFATASSSRATLPSVEGRH